MVDAFAPDMQATESSSSRLPASRNTASLACNGMSPSLEQSEVCVGGSVISRHDSERTALPITYPLLWNSELQTERWENREQGGDHSHLLWTRDAGNAALKYGDEATARCTVRL